MKKITEKLISIIAYAIAKVDTYLYRHFGYVSKTRRRIWQRNAIKIQMALNREHRLADSYNILNDTDYCTKKVMKEIGIEEVN